MIQIQQLKLPITHLRGDLKEQILKALKIKGEQLLDYRITRRSIDARKKQDILYVYTIEADTANDKKIVNRLHNNNIRYLEKKPYCFPSGF